MGFKITSFFIGFSWDSHGIYRINVKQNLLMLVGGLEHEFYFPLYMGCHSSH